jgi:hypothetical protein
MRDLFPSYFTPTEDEFAELWRNFSITLILSLYLPIAASDKLYANSNARKMVLWVAVLIALSGLAIEGSGAIINHGAKVALLHSVTSTGR